MGMSGTNGRLKTKLKSLNTKFKRIAVESRKHPIGIGWVFGLPSSMTIAHQLGLMLTLEGFLFQIVVHWHNFTTFVWEFIFSILNIEFNLSPGAINMLNIGSLLLASAFSMRLLRVRSGGKFFQPIPTWKGWGYPIKISISIALLFFIFGAEGFFANKGLSWSTNAMQAAFVSAIVILWVFIASLVTICVFLMVDEDKLAAKYNRPETGLAEKTMILAPGLLVQACSFGFLTLAIHAATFGVTLHGETNQDLTNSFLNVWAGHSFLTMSLLLGMHLYTNYNSARSIIEFAKITINIILCIFFVIATVLLVVGFDGSVFENSDNTKNLVIFALVAIMISGLYFSASTNENLILRIIVIAMVILTVNAIVANIGLMLSQL